MRVPNLRRTDVVATASIAAAIICVGLLVPFVTQRGQGDSVYVYPAAFAAVSAFALLLVGNPSRAADWTTCIVIAALPILYQAQKLLSFSPVPWLYVTPVSLGLALALLLRLTRLRRLTWTPADKFIALFAVLALLPLPLAHSGPLASIGYQQWILEPVLGYFLVRQVARPNSTDRLLLIATRSSLLIMLALMAVQIILAGGPAEAIAATASRTGYPLAGGYAEPSEAAAILVKIAPWYLCWAWAVRSRLDLLLGFATTVLVFGLVTRAATLELSAELALIVGLAARFNVQELKLAARRALPIAFIVAIVAAPILGPFYLARISGVPYNRANQVSADVLNGIPLEGNLLVDASRTLLTLEVVRDNPFGVGGFNAQLVNPSTEHSLALLYSVPVFESLIPLTTIAAHFGVLAAAVLLAALVRTVQGLWASLKENHAERVLGVGLLAAALIGATTGTLAPSVTWLGKLDPQGGVLRGETLFNGMAIWSMITLAIAANYLERREADRVHSGRSSTVEQRP